MAIGNSIIVQGGNGLQTEGTIVGTPKPGSCVTVVAATEPVNGRYSWEPFNDSGDGVRQVVGVLLPDTFNGKTATQAYATGTRCFIYFPLPGEILNMLIQDVSGTGDSHAIGDKFMIDDGTGELIAQSSPENEPFICMDTSAALTAEGLLACMYTGN